MKALIYVHGGSLHWTEVIRPGQFALFVFDVRTRMPRNADGSTPGPEGRSLAILDSLEEAIALANSLVARDPALYCEIYDQAGEYGQPLEIIQDSAFCGTHARSRARKELIGGACLFACGLVMAAIDFNREFRWIWGYVLGVKFMIIGTALMAAGVIGLRRERVPGRRL